ncbi:unnamed protein product, partial [Laminaria digitata]
VREGLIRHLAKPNPSPLRGSATRCLRRCAAVEPSIRFRIHTFQACSFSHSDTSPN